VLPQVGVGDQHGDEVGDLGGQRAEPLVVAGLLGQVREQVDDRFAGVADPPALVAEPEQGLHHRHRDQFSVGDLRGDPDRRPPPVELRGRLQLIVDSAVQCRREGVQIDVHVASMGSLFRQRRSWTPSLLFAVPYPLESII